MGEKTHRHEVVHERSARKSFQRCEQRAHRVEMFFSGRVEQQCADPRVSGNGREIAVAEVYGVEPAYTAFSACLPFLSFSVTLAEPFLTVTVLTSNLPS